VTEPAIEKTGEGRYCITGELNFRTVPQLADALESTFRDIDEVVVDLGKIDRSDSAGVALLVEWVRTATRLHKQVHFQKIPDQMLSIARVSDLDEYLPLIPE